MSSPPVILILEDNRLQLLALRAQLSELGALREFEDAGAALAFARGQPCDAAVVDVRLPGRAMDGLGFLRALREFDPALAVIVRTADSSERVADGAIEGRAVRRLIKSRTTMAELQGAVREAIAETGRQRELRRRAQAAAEAAPSSLVQGLRKRLTNLSVLASLMRVGAAEAKRPVLVDQADRTSTVVREMADSIDLHLRGALK